MPASLASEPAPSPEGLDALGARIQRGLQQLAWPGKEWVCARAAPDGSGAHVYDVLIVGAGQCGLSAAFGLMRERVRKVSAAERTTVGRIRCQGWGRGPWR